MREVALVTGAILAYFTIRNVTAGAPGEAFANGERIVDFEHWIGIDWEDGIQAAIVGRDGLATLANWIYIWGHWPVIIATMIWLVWRRRDIFLRLRNGMLVSGGIGYVLDYFQSSVGRVLACARTVPTSVTYLVTFSSW